MPHFYDFDGVEHKLFLLQNLSYSSKKYCEELRIARSPDNEETTEAWYQYFGHLKPTVSQTTIEAAVKIRMVQDFIKSEIDDDVDLSDLEKAATRGKAIGVLVGVGPDITLRDSCNKIIHATDAQLDWIVSKAANTTVEYWSGIYKLWGIKGDEPWHLELNIPEWCLAMSAFINSIQDAVDWSRVRKWDQ